MDKSSKVVQSEVSLPKKASIVIIGGGIVGCSIAYHLGKRGERDVVLLEKGELTSGSTWHAAGLVGQLRSSLNVTTMLTYSVDLYNRLEKETGQPTGWKTVGGLRLASSKDRMIELKKAATSARSFGMEMQLLSPKEALELFPIMSLDGVVGAAFIPTDGYADPYMVTMALAAGARSSGIKIIRQVRVTGIEVKNRMATVVKTNHGDIEADIVVNAAGMWAREVGQMAGVSVPLIAVQHQYMVTEVIPGLPKGLPTMRDPDNLVYYKEEVGGLVMGGYEHNPIPWSLNGISRTFGQELLPSDFHHFEPIAELAMKRTPLLANVGVRQLINGPEAFTPDGTYVMGKAPELKNYFVAAGFNAHGIAGGGGAGLMMAEWILDGRPSLDLWDLDITRFGRHHGDPVFLKERTLELYGKHYSISWPKEEHTTGRDVYKSPLYEILASHRAVFGSKYGWERPNWFAPLGVEGKDIPTFGWPNWHEAVGKEHQAIRQQVALIDQSSFSKFDIRGPGALLFLQRLVVNNVDKPIGYLTYTQLCNEQGGIEADVTVHRLEHEEFYIVTGTAFGTHDLAWIRDRMPEDGSVTITDVTPLKSVINVCGPLSRRLLQKVTKTDLTHENFRFAQVLPITIAGATVHAARVTYVGELGWELHMPKESAVAVYQALWNAGKEFNVINAGYRAIESCRLEKGYRYWSAELSGDYSPFQAGLGFCVDFNKPEFLGRAALWEEKQKGPSRKLCCFTLDRAVPMHGKETILLNGKAVGLLTSSGFGYTINKAIGYGYLSLENIQESGYQIQVLNETISAQREKSVLYDPKRERILS
ncbi:MAG: FAD-dependent oxidoreductase [Proteobacteria bacterium]|nr:FAD-dependent oxidoreductase [Pseudomonadota bacterium]